MRNEPINGFREDARGKDFIPSIGGNAARFDNLRPSAELTRPQQLTKALAFREALDERQRKITRNSSKTIRFNGIRGASCPCFGEVFILRNGRPAFGAMLLNSAPRMSELGGFAGHDGNRHRIALVRHQGLNVANIREHNRLCFRQYGPYLIDPPIEEMRGTHDQDLFCLDGLRDRQSKRRLARPDFPQNENGLPSPFRFRRIKTPEKLDSRLRCVALGLE